MQWQDSTQRASPPPAQSCPQFYVPPAPHLFIGSQRGGTGSILTPPPHMCGPGMEVGLPGSTRWTGCFLSWQREPENGVLEDFGAEERGALGAQLPAAH